MLILNMFSHSVAYTAGKRNLADAQNRGALDSDDFVLGMYLLQGAASGKISPIPTSIPAHLKQQIFEAPLRNTDPTPSILSTPSQSIPKIVIHPAVDPIIISPAIPRGEKRPLTPEKTPYHDWDITPLDKTKADQDFDILDAQKRNYIEGDVLGKYMLRFKLSPEDLAHIWCVMVCPTSLKPHLCCLLQGSRRSQRR